MSVSTSDKIGLKIISTRDLTRGMNCFGCGDEFDGDFGIIEWASPEVDSGRILFHGRCGVRLGVTIIGGVEEHLGHSPDQYYVILVPPRTS